ncbi:hypothetical protein HZQ67_07200 [Elizabethkingia anophelis]|uniref:hypothetical protein n=1 Tax=Elizabethkingia anophelis TaxID=1117645 RepID=UPI0004E443E1|nr:hypothetical protein [Elizabethkingia anophelis]KFC38827.1 hypothetical protein FF18_15665 [Elizabethkingia anophelis]MCT3787148.1 hypothetical protein [Elizabethkingia anophelis]MDV3502190.1 hypothetical protein [Elizabethkingia anophelis]MYY26879.1 hypothetical protein [Elizabethkingia anophelis]
MKKLTNLLLLASVAFISLIKAQHAPSEFYTQVTFPSDYQIGDYIEFASTNLLDANSSGYFEVSISYTRGNIASAATFITSISHVNKNVWKEAGMINTNDYIQYKNRNFTIDVNGGKNSFRLRAINTLGVDTPITVNIKIRSINQVYNWTTLSNNGNDNSITALQPMTDEWNLYVGNLFSDESAKIALKAISNGNVGIGTSSPQYKLDVNGSFRAGLDNFFSYNGGADIFLRYLGRGSGGRAIVHDNNNTLTLNYANDFSGGTLLGTSFLVKGDDARLNGKLEAKEIKVTTTPTADFVFEDSYQLPNLESVEKHIKEKKHLPEIASAVEMQKEGVNIGDFQIKLLQKIEELTLYQIQINKEVINLKQENNQLKETLQKIQNNEKSY